jgi:hypothetical protein
MPKAATTKRPTSTAMTSTKSNVQQSARDWSLRSLRVADQRSIDTSTTHVQGLTCSPSGTLKPWRLPSEITTASHHEALTTDSVSHQHDTPDKRSRLNKPQTNALPDPLLAMSTPRESDRVKSAQTDRDRPAGSSLSNQAKGKRRSRDDMAPMEDVEESTTAQHRTASNHATC